MVKYSQDPNKKVVRILSIDGGGLRGVIPAKILEALEEALSADFGRDIHLANYFDMIAGTSTGALIALGLSAIDPQTEQYYKASRVKSLYMEAGPKIFPKGFGLLKTVKQLFNTPYNSEPLQAELTTFFTDKKLSDITPHVIIPAYELQTNWAYVFDSKAATFDQNKDASLIDVALSTTAAPTFLSSHTIVSDKGDTRVFADGGVFANNPAWFSNSRFNTSSWRNVL